MELTYQKLRDRTDLTYQAQASSDLITWIDVPDDLASLPYGLWDPRSR
ncbi:MAG: hypothetical protein P8P32_02900 [Akkermansiaceae bacterium]|nr:hypothetical protein [Akkermansiaceae bacterium]MDG2322516.1 hypothetical protein [Akkermansiaceae bacterium]